MGLANAATVFASRLRRWWRPEIRAGTPAAYRYGMENTACLGPPNPTHRRARPAFPLSHRRSGANGSESSYGAPPACAFGLAVSVEPCFGVRASDMNFDSLPCLIQALSRYS